MPPEKKTASWRHNPDRGEPRRQQLLDALDELLQKKPLSDIAVGEIAAVANVGRSAFYFYFPSKESAVAELLGGMFLEMKSQSDDMLQVRGDPWQAFRVGIVAALVVWSAHEHLVLAAIDARGTSDEMREVWEQWIQLFAKEITAVISSERIRGRAPAGPPANVLAEFLLLSTERALERLLRRNAGERERTVAMDTLATVFVRSIYGADPHDTGH